MFTYLKADTDNGKDSSGLDFINSSLIEEYELEQASLPAKVMFILLPLFAPVLKVTYLRSKKFYIDHLIHSIHVHSFIFFHYDLIGTRVSIVKELLMVIKFFCTTNLHL